jgi:5-(carboxyamino)imidazole ribonucleotide synthase
MKKTKMTNEKQLIPDGKITVGILGGGQLAKMLSVAAHKLGFRIWIHPLGGEYLAYGSPNCQTYCRDQNCSECAEELPYDPDYALRMPFDKWTDIVTFESENVYGPLKRHTGCNLFPSIKALEIARDRLMEKMYIQEMGGITVSYYPVEEEGDFKQALSLIGVPSILKTRKLGYDGKGQVRINSIKEAEWMYYDPSILEKMIKFTNEFSVIAVRTHDGQIDFWDTVENFHENGILRKSIVDKTSTHLKKYEVKARDLVSKVLNSLEYVGVSAFEFFVDPNSDEPIFNEMAPRVHNSGHWTIEGAITSQFENHIRAICGLPLGSCASRSDRIEMENIIGEQINDIIKYLQDPSLNVHVYGKRECREGRKMGHITKIF